ncbi:MAG: hypothetical protein WC988_04105 [Patescibacteria group bacterium]
MLIYAWQKIISLAFSLALALWVISSIAACSKVYALTDYHLDFTLPQNILRDGQEIVTQFNWNIKDFNMVEQKRLTVKPFISAGAVEIYNEDLKKFVGIADFNSQLPYLQKEERLKFIGVQSLESSASLYFVIYDTLTGQKYETPVKKIWGMAYYKKYTDLLNENILKTSGDDKTLTESVVDAVKPTDDKPNDPIKIYVWYLSPAFFLYGLLKSPNGFG